MVAVPPGPWSIPTAFRLLDHTPPRQSPRLHGGGVVVRVTCTLPCHFTAGGYLTIPAAGGRHVHLRSARLAFTGTRALQLRLGKADRRTLSRALARRRPVQARLTLSAARAEFPHEGTAGTSQVKLRR